MDLFSGFAAETGISTKIPFLMACIWCEDTFKSFHDARNHAFKT